MRISDWSSDVCSSDLVDDDPVDRHHRHEDQGERHHPLDDVLSRVGDHFVDQMVDTHLGESSGGVASGGDGGFLQHDAYLWMWWFGVCLDRWDGCCEWNWLSGADLRSEEHTSELQS